jgi:Cu2+-exporting ATPase
LAAWSTHPLSRALADAGEAAASAPAWSAIEEVAGHGLSARDEGGRTWRLGAAAWVDATATAGNAAQVWLGCDGLALAAFECEEALRPGTAEALQVLRAEGVQVTVLTGDTPQRALALAARIGVDDVLAGATPEAKLAAVTAAQAAGRRVAMIGDGINDAPVLARADVSLAMGQGALVSRSQADAVIASNQLGDLVRARHTAQQALRIVRQNFVWAGSYNALCIPLALVGWLPPWAAGLGMALSSLVVVFNALRAAR